MVVASGNERMTIAKFIFQAIERAPNLAKVEVGISVEVDVPLATLVGTSGVEQWVCPQLFRVHRIDTV